MSYEEAPATALLATHCAVCRRPLLDAVSVEIGVGPVCRKQYLTELTEADEAKRHAANLLIHLIAVEQGGQVVVNALKGLLELGFVKVAKAILDSVATVHVAVTDETHPHGPGRCAVRTPYLEDAVSDFQKVPGRRWDRYNKINTFPSESKVAVFTVLCRWWPGQIGFGPKGPFILRKLEE